MVLAALPPVPSKLDICLPKIPDGGCYQLLSIGGIRRQIESSMEFEISLFFKFRPSLHHTYKADGNILRCYVHYHHAPLLVVGSLWTAEGKLIDTGSSLFKVRRTISFGEHLAQTSTFNSLFPNFSSVPVLLHHAQKDSWCMVINKGSEIILIPCFELLRALFYRVEAIILDLFFSQIPLNLFCSVDTLTSDLAALSNYKRRIWRVEVKVSSYRFLSAPGVRILAELACNNHAYLTFLKAQTHQFNELAAHKQYDPYKEAQFWISPVLGHSVNTQVNGQSFTHNNKKYFLVNSFTSITNFTSFRKLLAQFLKRKMPISLNSQLNTLLNYPELSSLLRPEREYANIPNSTSPSTDICALIDLEDMSSQQTVHSSTRWDFQPSPIDGSISMPGRFSLD